MLKKILPYSLFLLFIPFFGFNFLFNFLGNILLLIILIPVLLLVITFLGINSIKENIKQCKNCGLTILGDEEICMNCGSGINSKLNKNENYYNAKSQIIEIDAEEVD